MKKIVNLKEIFIVLMVLSLITVTTSVFAIDPSNLSLSDNSASNNGQVQPITGDEYAGAQTITEEKNETLGNNTTDDLSNNSANNSLNTNTNNVKKYNTVDKEDEIPQTGIEDYNIGILLIICVGSAIFAYKKMEDYRNI